MKLIHLFYAMVLLTGLSGCKSNKDSSELDSSLCTGQITVPEIKDLRVTHPRLFISIDQFDELKQKIDGDTMLTGWYEEIKKDAGEILSLPPSQHYIRDGVRLLSVSREVVRRVYTLAFLYRMEGDTKYLKRVWQELEAVAAFPDWNPSHFLDVGEMCHAFAIGYDWLFQDLSEDQRSIIREALIDKGIGPYIKGSESGDGKWVKNITNWNFVCNGGVGIAAPKDEYWNPPEGMKKLSVHFENVKRLTIKISFKEASEGIQKNHSDKKIIPLEHWENK